MKRSRSKQQALARIAIARKIKEATNSTFEKMVIEARDNGCTLREIEKVSGMTNPGVLFLERRVRAKRSS